MPKSARRHLGFPSRMTRSFNSPRPAFSETCTDRISSDVGKATVPIKIAQAFPFKTSHLELPLSKLYQYGDIAHLGPPKVHPEAFHDAATAKSSPPTPPKNSPVTRLESALKRRRGPSNQGRLCFRSPSISSHCRKALGHSETGGRLVARRPNPCLVAA
jgi:hypothetical protein